MLKIVCEFATCLPKLSGFKKATNFIIYEANGKNIIVPNILNERCNNAAFFAVLFAPNEAIIAVTHVPILHPNTIGNAIFMSIVPADANATNIAVVADELCTIAVIITPTKTLNTEYLPKTITTFLNTSNSATGFIDEDINPIPINNIPNPIKITEISLIFFFLAVNAHISPTPINIGATTSNLKLTICAVIVVPILEPNITPIA